MIRWKRPLVVMLLAVCALLLAASQLYRIVLVIDEWNFLQKLIQISPNYIVIGSVIWGCVFLYIAIMIWRGMKNAPIFTMVGYVLFLIFRWIERLWISSSFVDNWLFLLISEVIILACLVIVFSRKNVKAFFRDNHADKLKNSSPS
jgi:hypothetical protein